MVSESSVEIFCWNDSSKSAEHQRIISLIIFQQLLKCMLFLSEVHLLNSFWIKTHAVQDFGYMCTQFLAMYKYFFSILMIIMQIIYDLWNLWSIYEIIQITLHNWDKSSTFHLATVTSDNLVPQATHELNESAYCFLQCEQIIVEKF